MTEGSTVRAQDDTTTTVKRTEPPVVPGEGPPGAFLVELLVYNAHPFMDHWAYWICSKNDPNVGVYIHVTGDVRNGFAHEIKRYYDLESDMAMPTSKIPLQWVDSSCFDEPRMFNGGIFKFDNEAVCSFEESALSIPAPEKSLNTVSSSTRIPSRVRQRNCQTWIVESAVQLNKDGILTPEVVDYLHLMKQ